MVGRIGRTAVIATAAILTLTATAAAQGSERTDTWIYENNEDPITQEQQDYLMYIDGSSESAVAIKCFGPENAEMIYAVGDVGDKMAMVTGDDAAYLSYRIGGTLQGSEERWQYNHNDDVAQSGPSVGERTLSAIAETEIGATAAWRIYNTEGSAVSTVDATITDKARNAARRMSCYHGAPPTTGD